jgi:hypothetical protein
LTQSLSPTFLTVLNDNDRLTLEELRHFWELADELALNGEPNTSTTQQDKHSLIEGLKVIYG